MAKYKKIEGEFIIYKNGDINCGNKRLKVNDTIVLKIGVLKQIIRDSKEGVI